LGGAYDLGQSRRVPQEGDEIRVKQDDSSWRPAIWQAAKEERDPATGSDLIWVTYTDTPFTEDVSSVRIQPRTGNQPPPA
jgi:hypothetical protein